MIWRIAARWPFRLILWPMLADRCDRIMREVYGMPGCANRREHRERGL